MNSRSQNNRNVNSRSGGGRREQTSTRGHNDQHQLKYNNHTQQLPQQQQQQPPPQQQQQYTPNLSQKDQADLDSFRIALKELTFNSRPIIEKLTQMAKERARNIPGPVSRSILDNLVFNNPNLRSCFLFLIDSISKNIGEPYTASFVKHGLVSAYLRVYGEICAAEDEAQKKDFLRVLPTWNGVFPPEAIREIESKIGIPINQNRTSQIQPPSLPFSPATVRLLQDLKNVFENPPGPHISGIVSEIFNRLSRGGEISRETLADLDNKAKMLDKSSIISTIKEILVQGQITRVSDNSMQPIPPESVAKTVPPTENVIPFIPLNFELPPNFQIDLSLLSSIVNLNNSNSTLTSPTKSSKSSNIDKHFIHIPLNSSELLVSRPQLFKVIYDDLPLHCKTCGVRFRDTELGNERMTRHLDSHFRRNMRLKEKSKRVMARDWFVSENDWITAKIDSESNSEKTVNVFEDLSVDNELNSKNELKDDFFIEATEEEQNIPVKCFICQEIVPLHWNDETEQWTFQGCDRNELNHEIFHKNCQNNEFNNSKRQKQL